MSKYSKSVIYNLTCKDKNVSKIYIGSSYDEIKREGDHRTLCINENDKRYNLKVYQFIRDNGGYDNWTFEVIDRYPCDNEIQLVIRERYYYDLLNPELNSQRPYVSEAELKEERKIYNAKYREKNNALNKQKFKCECGGNYTHKYKSTHCKTKTHIAFIEKNNQNTTVEN